MKLVIAAIVGCMIGGTFGACAVALLAAWREE